MNVLRRRAKLFISHGYQINLNSFPFNLNQENIIDTCQKVAVNGKIGLVEIPSFLRIYKAIKLGLNNDGIEYVMNQKSNYSYNE